MALTRLTKDMDIIQKLGDEPNDVDGLTSTELKAKFDEGNNAMKQWVNETFIPEVENEIKASRLENLPEHAHTHAKDGRDPITPESIGARPDTWTPNAADVGAAPAGYGLGEVRGKAVADPKTISVSGYYQIDTANAVNCPELIPNYAYGAIQAVVRGTQVELTFYIFGHYATMHWDGDATNAVWEYVNPPMTLGVEYRTTERYMGKPVYAKLVDCGLTVVGDWKSISVGAENFGRMVSLYGTIDGRSFPTLGNITSGLTGDWNAWLCFAGSQIEIWSGTSLGNRQCYVIAKYIKTKD